MLNIQIEDIFLSIQNIDRTSIQKIYSLYRNSNDFKYATGVFQSIEDEQFVSNISQFIQRDDVFFLDIRLNSGETIGLIKGLVIKNEKIVWINSMIIDTPYQRMGYGKKAIGLLLEYFKQVCSSEKIYLSVCKSNIPGINFWAACGFKFCNWIPGREVAKYNDTVQIMYKLL